MLIRAVSSQEKKTQHSLLTSPFTSGLHNVGHEGGIFNVHKQSVSVTLTLPSEKNQQQKTNSVI